MLVLAFLLIASVAFAQQPPNCALGGFVISPDKTIWVCKGASDAPVQVSTGGDGGPASWGAITGTLSDQTDLQTALDSKGTSNFSGAYADLTGKPTLGTAAATASTDYATAAQGTKADSALQPNGNGSQLTGLTKAQVGLGNVDNTSDANKPISTATQTALNGKAASAHTHAAADVTTGTLDIARIPTGTTSTTAALGNHTHAQLHDRAHAITSTSDHSFPGGTSTFLRADGTFATPSGGGGASDTVLILAGDVSTGANTTLVDLTGMSFTADAGGIYLIDIAATVQSAAATTGYGIGINCAQTPQLVSFGGGSILANTGTATMWSAIANNAIVGVTSGVPSAATNVATRGHGVLVAHASNAGTCIMRYRSETTAVTTMKANSLFIVRKVN